MNQAVITVREETSAARCHEIFTSLMLRHLCVVDAGNRLVGIITRKDLDHHAGSGKWRMTAPPTMPSTNTLQSDEALARLARQGSRRVLGRAYPSRYHVQPETPPGRTPASSGNLNAAAHLATQHEDADRPHHPDGNGNGHT